MRYSAKKANLAGGGNHCIIFCLLFISALKGVKPGKCHMWQMKPWISVVTDTCYFAFITWSAIKASICYGISYVRCCIKTIITAYPYKLCHENRVVRNRYSRLLFTSEGSFSVNWHVQEQSTNMTSQCKYPTFTWHQRSAVVASQC